MLPSSTAVSLSQAPPAPVQWYDHVLRKKYRDPLKLKQALTAMYGEGNYRIKVRTGLYFVTDWSRFCFILYLRVNRNRSGRIGGL